MTDTNTYRFLIEYDGTEFAGWQRQGQGERTVQETLETALEQILQHPVSLIGAGRTDAGVHAEGMVASAKFPTPKMSLDRLMLAVNSMCEHDVQIHELTEAAPDFHARFSAVSRSYRYRLECVRHPMFHRFSWVPPFDWNDSKIADAVVLIPGRHCFRSFCLERPGETEYISNVLSAVWEPDSSGATFRITADRFFHKMVRSLVMGLYDVGRGYHSLEDFRKLLDQPDPAIPVRVAPAQGLTLVSVGY